MNAEICIDYLCLGLRIIYKKYAIIGEVKFIRYCAIYSMGTGRITNRDLWYKSKSAWVWDKTKIISLCGFGTEIPPDLQAYEIHVSNYMVRY